MLTVCSYCKKKITKSRGQVNKYKRNFCNRECYLEYVRQHKDIYPKGTKRGKQNTLNNLKQWAELRNVYKID